MTISVSEVENVKQQIINAGIRQKDGSVVFHGKLETIVLKNGKLDVISFCGGHPYQGLSKVGYILHEIDETLKLQTSKDVEDKKLLYELIHMILRCNGQKGFKELPGFSIVNDLNDYARNHYLDF